MFSCGPTSDAKTLKSEQIAAWFKSDWMTRFPNRELMTVWSQNYITNAVILDKIDRALNFAGYRYAGCTQVESPVVVEISDLNGHSDIAGRIGAFVLRFTPEMDGEAVEVLAATSHYADDHWYQVTLAALPIEFRIAWTAFCNECARLAYDRPGEVIIVGGRTESFVPTVAWDEIVLPGTLKADLMDDVRAFYEKGVGVYQRLNLKPFRKVLLAGVPGTGKTMLCNALAKWALSQKYLVIYVSSAQKGQNDQYGSTFGKIQYALQVAANADVPSLILLEELDAYLHDEEKALILNVLDGSESDINPRGTLLISTTNYPEAIDERVLKRPGRLDRIFIIPEMHTAADAEAMLRRYLGVMWQDAHKAIVPELVGSPGAFIREVAVYALTQVAYDDLPELSLNVLEQSLQRLREQLSARDDFLKQRAADTQAQPTNGHH
jgi:energy-coupling factor transporter ATP-binding protein EcfA2